MKKLELSRNKQQKYKKKCSKLELMFLILLFLQRRSHPQHFISELSDPGVSVQFVFHHRESLFLGLLLIRTGTHLIILDPLFHFVCVLVFPAVFDAGHPGVFIRISFSTFHEQNGFC